jgi:hypothetical protein
MGNAYLTSIGQNQYSQSSSLYDDEDDGFDSEVSTALASLLEENARLRALVVQLSDLVLKNIVDQK